MIKSIYKIECQHNFPSRTYKHTIFFRSECSVHPAHGKPLRNVNIPSQVHKVMTGKLHYIIKLFIPDLELQC